MKFQLFAFVLVVVGAWAMPPASDAVVVDSPNPERFVVENQIRRVIQMISSAIKDAGFDPLVIQNEEFVFSPVPLLVEVKVLIDNLRFAGASNIRIHSLDYSLLLNRLRFDISLPQISLVVGEAVVEASVNDQRIDGQFGGSLSINAVRLSGEVRVNIGVISGISLRSVSLNFRVGDIRSDVSVVIQENDYSDELNSLLNVRIPDALDQNRDAINRLLENIVEVVFDRFPF